VAWDGRQHMAMSTGAQAQNIWRNILMISMLFLEPQATAVIPQGNAGMTMGSAERTQGSLGP
jgi:hypothetical protein